MTRNPESDPDRRSAASKWIVREAIAETHDAHRQSVEELYFLQLESSVALCQPVRALLAAPQHGKDMMEDTLYQPLSGAFRDRETRRKDRASTWPARLFDDSGTVDDGTRLARNVIPSISLPKGSGAIRSIREKFAANPLTGTVSMAVPVYTSHGFGCCSALPTITRKTDKDYVIHRFRPCVEALFARTARWTKVAPGETHCRGITRDNVATVYGRDNSLRIVDPADPNRNRPAVAFDALGMVAATAAMGKPEDVRVLATGLAQCLAPT